MKPAETWYELRDQIDELFHTHGWNTVSPRGKLTIEVCNVDLCLAWNLDVEHLPKFDKEFAEKRLEVVRHKIHFTLNEAIKLLQEDPNTRRAYVLEADYHPNNVPCVLVYQFLLREGILDMLVYLRSSDLIEVLPLDIYVFQNILDDVAEALSVEKGRIHLHIGSLHRYV